MTSSIIGGVCHAEGLLGSGVLGASKTSSTKDGGVVLDVRAIDGVLAAIDVDVDCVGGWQT